MLCEGFFIWRCMVTKLVWVLSAVYIYHICYLETILCAGLVRNVCHGVLLHAKLIIIIVYFSQRSIEKFCLKKRNPNKSKSSE